jgi:NitT/TauT family transport system substrate-binding protein
MIVDRRRVLQAGLTVPALAAASSLRAADLTPFKFVGAAAVARPDQGFMFVGMKTGFYKDLGLQADFFTTNGSGSVIQLIATNQAQLGHCGMQELMATKLSNPGLPVKAVYLQEVGAGYEIVVPEASPIKAISDFKGKNIGVISLASGAVPFVKAMLRTGGVDPKSVDLLPVGTGAQALAALRSGRVDALSLFRGSHAALENLGITFRYFTVPYASSVMIANESYIAKNRSTLVAALKGQILSQAFAVTNPEAAVRIYWDLNGRPREDEAKALSDGVHLIKRASELWTNVIDGKLRGSMSDEDWLKLARFSDITISTADVESLYTDDLIDDVNKVDVKVAIDAAKSQ